MTKLLNRQNLEEIGIEFSNTHLLRLEGAGKFPKRVRLSPHRVAWIEHEIEDFLTKLATERDGDPDDL